MLDCGRPDQPLSGPAYEMKRFAHFALTQVSGMVTEIKKLPVRFDHYAPNGDSLRVVHASMRNNRDGVYPMTPNEDLREQIAPAPAVFVTGHTHVPLVRHVDHTLVVNIGSVGSPFDKDRRPAYGRFTWTPNEWRAEVVRIPYDYSQIEADYVRSGFLEHGGPLTQIMLVELRKARGLIHRWAAIYERDVLSGLLTLEESVRLFLCQDEIRPFTGSPGWTV